jgi:capsular polysaccharide transport system permease protein
MTAYLADSKPGLQVKRDWRTRVSFLWLAALMSMAALVYWTFIASDRFVSEAHVIVQRTDMAVGPALDIASLMGGQGGHGRPDQMLLRDYLLSIDMLKMLESRLRLSAHYSDPQRDLFSRMWLISPSIEWLHRHFQNRTSVEFDEYAGVLMIKTEAYDPAIARAIAQAMVTAGEQFMDEMARKLAREQVSFLEKQVQQNADRAIAARQAVLAYQNRKGMVAPEAAAENLIAIIGQLEAKRAELQTERNALQAYLVPTHPSVVQISQQLAAIERQIAGEQAKLAAPAGMTLNRTVEELQRLQLEAEFQKEVYKSTLAALEKGRIEATRTLKKLSVLQAPNLPEYPLQPRRIYNVVVFTLLAYLVAGVLMLLIAAIRDHQD